MEPKLVSNGCRSRIRSSRISICLTNTRCSGNEEVLAPLVLTLETRDEENDRQGHTFKGDLRVSLHKGSQAVVLHDRSGGGADDIVQSFDVGGFDGQDLAGEWRVVVVDTANQDVGTLVSWSLSAVVE